MALVSEIMKLANKNAEEIITKNVSAVSRAMRLLKLSLTRGVLSRSLWVVSWRRTILERYAFDHAWDHQAFLDYL